MALNQVNTGSAPNAGDGDTLRAAFTTFNTNMVKIPSKKGAGNPNTLGIVGDYDGQTFRNTTTRELSHWDEDQQFWT